MDLPAHLGSIFPWVQDDLRLDPFGSLQVLVILGTLDGPPGPSWFHLSLGSGDPRLDHFLQVLVILGTLDGPPGPSWFHLSWGSGDLRLDLFSKS